MASEMQWMYVTDKYALVELIDGAIVVARFNQKDLLRDFIEIRSKILEAKDYDEIILILDILLEINNEIKDKRLAKEIARIIDRITAFKNNEFEYDEGIEKVESRASD